MKSRLAITVALMFTATPSLAQSARLDELIDVGGYRMRIICEGQAVKGAPTVILDSGGGSSSSSWRLVQPEVAKFARVCGYDRPGLGRSERKPKPYTSPDVMKDLHTLLAEAKISKPYVMAGHSLGGMHIRLFAKLYPKEVAGMVFVDSFNEDELAPERSTIPPEVKKQYPPEYFKPFIAEDMDLETIAAQARANKWCGHNIQLDQPEIVVESIRQVIAATGRKDRKLSQQ